MMSTKIVIPEFAANLTFKEFTLPGICKSVNP